MGDAALAAHQIAFQLFVFLALVLDAVAIAGQVIVGRSLGAGDADEAYRAAAADDPVWGMLFASVAVFVPIALVSLALDWGIVGVWSGLLALIAARLATCAWRFRGRRWAIVGAHRARA